MERSVEIVKPRALPPLGRGHKTVGMSNTQTSVHYEDTPLRKHSSRRHTDEISAQAFRGSPLHVDESDKTLKQETPAKSGGERRKNFRNQRGEIFNPGDSILADIQQLSGDIVVPLSPLSHDRPSSTNISVNPPIGRLFIEQERNFVSSKENNVHSQAKVLDSELHIARGTKSPIDLGLSLLSFTTNVAHWCHGILAGFGLHHCIMAYLLSSPTFSNEDFLQHYALFSQPVQATFYFLLALCAVSTFEKCDISRLSFELGRELLENWPCLLSLLVYIVTLELSLFIADIEDGFVMQNWNFTVLQDQKDLSYIEKWKNLNLCRCLGSVLGWILICHSQTVNFLKQYLETIVKNSDIHSHS